MKSSVYRVSISEPRILIHVSDWGTKRAARAEAERINQTRTVGRPVAMPARMDGYPYRDAMDPSRLNLNPLKK